MKKNFFNLKKTTGKEKTAARSPYAQEKEETDQKGLYLLWAVILTG